MNVLFLLGLALAPLLAFVLRRTRWGLVVRTVGDSRDAALALGFHVNRVRALCTMIGGFLAGVGGSFLSLYYPGSWNEGLSSGQGLMAVALVVFARWEPLRCLYAALLFGAAGALGPALQSVGITSGYYLFNAAPYVLTLLLMLATCSPDRALAGMPQELGATKRSIIVCDRQGYGYSGMNFPIGQSLQSNAVSPSSVDLIAIRGV